MPEQSSHFHPILTPAALSATNTPIPWWLRAIVILGAVLLAIGALLALFHPAMLASPHDEINEAVHIYAGYLASRNLALAIMLVALLSLTAKHALSNMMVLAALIQLLDAVIDCAEGRWILVPGVVLLGLIFFIGAVRLTGYPFWRSQFRTQ